MTSKRKAVIVGGGMAGLAAAWELSGAGWQDRFESITVYQRGGRLGGKGASSRGVHGRIEEHGLHVWLGYYHNAFRLMREVYDELDRPSTAPECPIRTFDDAFLPADDVGVGPHGGDVTAWMACFGRNDMEPGRGDLTGRAMTVADFVRQAVQLVATLIGSVAPMDASRPRPRVVLSGSAEPPPKALNRGFFDSLGQLRSLVRQAEMTALVAGIEALALLERVAPANVDPTTSAVLQQLGSFRREVEDRVRRSETGSKLWQVMDLVLGCVQGAVEARLLDGDGFGRIDHLDFREWLRPRVSPDTLASPLITGLYDLVFAYERGERSRPRFSAGLGLFLAGRLFLEYRGSIFMKMRAGMGDVVFAPLFQALRARGVRFEFFHRLDEVRLTAGGRSIERLVFGRQARLADPRRDYEPLLAVRGLPCFPDRLAPEQFSSPPSPGSESLWSDRSPVDRVDCVAGRDFDVAVLAVSLGMIPVVAPALVERLPGWRAMVHHVTTVSTEALQLWMTVSDRELGWPHPGATVSGFESPFDTYSSMTHLLDAEDWPDEGRPGAVGYFCSALPDRLATSGASAQSAVRRHADEFLDCHVGRVWPGAVASDGTFRRDRLASVYHRANVDPSDRYVQSMPGSGAHRLRVDQSGCDNLVLAGDWTNCGLNAGCVEAAVMSGIEAANVAEGRPLTHGLAGRWYGLAEAPGKMAARATG